MFRKKIGCFALAAVLTAGLTAGCGDQKNNGSQDVTSMITSVETTKAPEATKAEVTPEATKEAEVTQTPTPEPTKAESKYEVPDITMEAKEVPDTEAFTFVKEMKIGWNLGNTLDASDCTWLTDELKYESAWCGVITTPRLITAVKEAGFNTIRIPVSWHNHTSGEDFTISEVWMARVKEVVDMAINEGMYVILNVHHDVDTASYYPTTEHLDTSKHYLSCVWKQIAEKFADYDEHLIFETLNEPRMIGSNYEWWIDPNNESCKDAISCINELNQTALDAIRATAGNNPTRYVMVPGYDASPDGALNAGFSLPKDSAENKLIVSVHAYTPYDFALNEGGTNKFDSDNASDVRGITGFMDQLYDRFIKNSIPVVIGEFGARAKSGNVQDRVDFSVAYIAAARARGITCCWWDNNAFIGNGENFGLIDRASSKWKFEEIVTGLMKYAE